MKAGKVIFAKSFLRSKKGDGDKKYTKNKSENAKRHHKTVENIQRNKKQIGYIDKTSRIS